MTKSSRTSQRKADANRRNASKSTGPRTPQGKAWSRLNALKHGILASQAVITTIEGRAQRKMFEAMVDGLEVDFRPVGTYEQLLVQEITACFWRKRRLLMFETRAAFDLNEQTVNAFLAGGRETIGARRTPYLLNAGLCLADDVYSAAGLDGVMLPSETDVNRVMRYEAAINRTRDRAVASLQAMRKVRRAEEKEAGAKGRGASSREKVAVVVDREAARRNARNNQVQIMPALAAVRIWDAFADAQREKRMERAAAEEAEFLASENDQTKPNNPSELSRQERIDRAIRDVFQGGEEPEAPQNAPETPPEDRDKPLSA